MLTKVVDLFCDNSWLGRQDVNRTFDDEIEVDLATIRSLFTEAETAQDESE